MRTRNRDQAPMNRQPGIDESLQDSINYLNQKKCCACHDDAVFPGSQFIFLHDHILAPLYFGFLYLGLHNLAHLYLGRALVPHHIICLDSLKKLGFSELFRQLPRSSCVNESGPSACSDTRVLTFDKHDGNWWPDSSSATLPIPDHHHSQHTSK